MGSKFNDIIDIFEQLPFFCCPNSVINDKWQKDISRYVYSKDTNTQPYKGAYGDIPGIWIEKYYLISNTINLKNKQIELKMKKKHGNK